MLTLAPLSRRHFVLALAVGAGSLLIVPAARAAAPASAAATAVNRTEAFIATFKKVKDGENLSAADQKANEKIFTELDKFMDFATLTSKPIEPRAAKFTAKQKADFSTRFRSLVRRIAYPDSGAFFRNAKIKVGEPGEKDGATVVALDAHLPKDDLRTKVELFWAKKAGALKLVDVAFDGDSLIKDYQNQFGRIIDKDGVPGLMKKLDEKEAELARGVRNKEGTAAK